jgi:hypothetical protein
MGIIMTATRTIVLATLIACCVAIATAATNDTPPSATATADSKPSASETKPTVAQQITGSWSGTWTTTRDGGDAGPLRCTVTGQTNGLYNARFRATYKKIFPFLHSVELHAKQMDGYIEVTGTAKLADWAGGNYTYSGKIEGDSFICNYKSDKDSGVFDLKRSK